MLLLLLLAAVSTSHGPCAAPPCAGGRAADTVRALPLDRVEAHARASKPAVTMRRLEFERTSTPSSRGDAGRCPARADGLGFSRCSVAVGLAGLTFFVFDPRSGRTLPVRATLSRRGVRVTVRF